MTQDTKTEFPDFEKHELSHELKTLFDGVTALLKPYECNAAPALALLATVLGKSCARAYGKVEQALLLQVAMKNFEEAFNEESDTLCLHMMSMAHVIGDDNAHEEIANAPTSRTKQ